jgi:ribosomal protein S18 acetylase RimI-like enzyme
VDRSESSISLRYGNALSELAGLEPLWNALQEHHSEMVPILAGQAPKRDIPDAWQVRRAKYERSLQERDSFFVVAERAGKLIGYAFVTVGSGYASWETGDLLAELETLSVLRGERGGGVGKALLGAVWTRLEEMGVDDLAITTAVSNVGSQRFYERHGFSKSFFVYYGKRGG